jgi:hypothetical protein
MWRSGSGSLKEHILFAARQMLTIFFFWIKNLLARIAALFRAKGE